MAKKLSDREQLEYIKLKGFIYILNSETGNELHTAKKGNLTIVAHSIAQLAERVETSLKPYTKIKPLYDQEKRNKEREAQRKEADKQKAEQRKREQKEWEEQQAKNEQAAKSKK